MSDIYQPNALETIHARSWSSGLHKFDLLVNTGIEISSYLTQSGPSLPFQMAQTIRNQFNTIAERFFFCAQSSHSGGEFNGEREPLSLRPVDVTRWRKSQPTANPALPS